MVKITPDIFINRVTDISLELLDRLSIKGIILDVDNTLTSHGNADPEVGVLDWCKEISEKGIKLIIVSNNSRKRVKGFAAVLSLEFISRGFKPLTRGFFKAASLMGLKPFEVAVVGDQLFTDILGGNLTGMKTILVEPYKAEDGPFFRLKRNIEHKILKDFKKD